MAIQISTNSTPYYDDFDANKNFLRILFQPGKNVQNRELIQAQTILQNQLGNLGNTIFKNGTRVIGAGIVANFEKQVLAIKDDLGVSVVVDATWIGQTITTASGVALVTHVDLVENVVLVNYQTGIFSVDETFAVGVNSYAVEAMRFGTTAAIDNGIIYSDGYFVNAFSNEIVVDASITANGVGVKYNIGTIITEKIITENDDLSLNDNSLGSINESAPGAHRLARTIDLVSYIEGAIKPDGFETAIVAEESVVLLDVSTKVKYSEIMTMLARRTHDESGDYTVEDYNVYPDINAAAPTTTFDLKIDEGKAYVNGYELDTFPTTLTLQKSQTQKTIANVNINANYGVYFDILKVNGVDQITQGAGAATFDFANNEALEFYTTQGGTPIDLGTTIPHVASVTRNANGELRFFITNTQGLSAIFNAVRFIKGVVSGAEAEIELYSGFPILGNVDKRRMIFDIPNYNAVASTSNVGYYITTQLNAIPSAGVATFTAPNPDTFSVAADKGIISVSTDLGIASSADYVVSTGASTLILDFSGGTKSGATGVNLTVSVYRTSQPIKTKTLSNITETITTPVSSILSLSRRDIVSVASVSIVGHTTIADYTLSESEYIVDNGQTDVSYELGAIVLKDATLADGAASFTVVYDYFLHSSGDYFSANSYTGSIDYGSIPTYNSVNGGTWNLANVLDFRTTGTGSLPTGQSVIQFDHAYYEQRIDKVYLDQFGKFGVKVGIPSTNPSAPLDKDGVMTLASVTIPEYTSNVEDVIIEMVNNRVYQMTDIKKLEDRISNLEYYSSLNLLEQNAKDLNVSDALGNVRFKNGIFVDTFTSHDAGDVTNIEYDCSVDTNEGLLMPNVAIDNFELVSDVIGDLATQQTLGMVISDDKIANGTDGVATLDYTEVEYVNQSHASTTINVNPYAVFSWKDGKVTISPTSDFWWDVRYLPTAKRTVGNHNGVGVKYSQNNWNSGWFGFFRYTKTTKVVTYPTSYQTVADKIIDTSAIRKMRPRAIRFWAENMRPTTTLKVLFDGVDVTSNCLTPNGTPFDATTKFDSSGSYASKALPAIFNIPANTFNTGTKKFVVTDVDGTSNGDTSYSSNGLLRTRRRTVTTVKGVASHSTTTITASRRRTRWFDPIAQSFMVDMKGGLYLSSVDLFFKTKDNSLPISLEIVEMRDGSPTQDTVNGSKLVKNAVDVNISENGIDAIAGYTKAATTFNFETPVYLHDSTEYAIVVKSNSQDYEMFIATIGNPELVSGDIFTNPTGAGISKQPYAGVMFKSQNASTWTEDQKSDVKFKLNRCKFVSNGSMTFNVPVATDGTNFFFNEVGGHSVFEADRVNIDISQVDLPDTTLDMTYKLDGEVVGTSFGDNDSVFLPNTATSVAALGVKPVEVVISMSTLLDNISPAIDVTRVSCSTTSNNFYDVVGGVGTSTTYISKSTTLSIPAEDIKVLFDASRDGGSTIDVYFKSTPYVGRYFDLLNTQTLTDYDTLLHKNLAIYERTLATNNVVQLNGAVATKVDNALKRVWVKDVNDTTDFQAIGATIRFMAEGSIPDANIPTWLAGTTYTQGDYVFDANGNGLFKLDVASSVGSDPTLLVSDWTRVPVYVIDSALVIEGEAEWRLMKQDSVIAPDVDVTNFVEYTYIPEALPDEPFTNFAIKIVTKTNNKAQVAKISKLRVLAVT